ncbi:MAG: hypothetical protein IH959_04155 [Chloroflexi bacterium]|nr:hypothetical protein [Chloroflexota bacterium]
MIDVHGAESSQTDIIIYDRHVASIFEIGGVQFFPCETVIAVGEVKSQIDSAHDLKDALEKIRSVKTLDRSNEGTNELVTGPGISLEGVQFDPMTTHRDQILGFAFTGGSLRQDAIVKELLLWNATHARTEWLNLYCDYTRFLFSYEGEHGLSPSAMDAEKIYCTAPEEVPDLLLLFVSILSTFVNHAHVARPKYFDYADIETTQHTDYPLVLPDETDPGSNLDTS